MGYFSDEAIEGSADDSVTFEGKTRTNNNGYNIPDEKAKGEEENGKRD